MFLRRWEQKILRYLYRNRTIRLAEKWNKKLKALTFSTIMVYGYTIWNAPFQNYVSYFAQKHKPYVSNTTPYKYTQEQWNTIQHYNLSYSAK